MAVLRKEAYTTHQVREDRKKIKSEKKSTTNIKPIEFINVLLVISAVVFLGIQVMSNYSSIYENNKKLQEKESLVSDVKRENKELTAEVDELNKFERIMEKAKAMGLQLDEDNVKVIQE